MIFRTTSDVFEPLKHPIVVKENVSKLLNGGEA